MKYEKTNDKYYVMYKDNFVKRSGGKYRKHMPAKLAYPFIIEGLEEFDLFISYGLHYPAWAMYEGVTGMKCSSWGAKHTVEKTVTEELFRSLDKEAIFLVEIMGYSLAEARRRVMREQIDKVVATEGVTPRYMEEI